MAIKEVEAFGNKIQGNGTVNVFLMNYNTGVSPESLQKTAGSEITQTVFKPGDTRFYPYTQQVFFHDNDISGGGKSPDGRIEVIKAMAAALGGTLPDIQYDGVLDPAWPRKGNNPGQICLTNNGAATFLNFDAAENMKHPITDAAKYGCMLKALDAVSIPQTYDAKSGGPPGTP